MTTPTIFRPTAWPAPRPVDTAAVGRVLKAITLELWRLFVAAMRALGRIPEECWPPILVTALAGVLAVAALVGFLADQRSWGEIGWSLLGGLLICLVIVVAYVTREKTISGRGKSKFTARRTITGNVEVKAYYRNTRGHTAHFVAAPARTDKPRCSPLVAVHEGGHAAAVEGVGGQALEAKVTSWGGWTRGRLPCKPSLFDCIVDDVAFSAGGEVAVHTSQGCSGDHAMMNDALKRLPWGDRGRAKAQGYSKARTAQWTHGQMRNKVARSLYTKGHWKR